LQRSRRDPWYFKLLRNLFSFFAILLWIAALLCFVPGVDLPQLGIAILTVILVNGLFAFLQEYKSDRALEMLQQLIAQQSKVIRDGAMQEIAAAALVPGDVIVLEEGDLVPADCRITEAFEVEVDNSSLTGESSPARRYKSDQPVLITGKFLWIELPNILFAGTSLLRGRARGVVFGTAMNSEIGKIANLTQEIAIEQSPLQKQLRATVYAIAALAGGLGLAFLFLGWLVAGLTFLEAFVFFIGLFVANVPEGLLPTVTLSLAMGVQRMAKRHALVKSLPSVETLGCTTVICCDKTGTLTQNLTNSKVKISANRPTQQSILVFCFLIVACCLMPIAYSSYCSLSLATTVGSANVVVSPIVRPSAISRSKRRMILPLRVFGNSAAKRISSGRAIGPIFLATCALSSSVSALLPSTPALSETNAQIAWPLISCALPMTAASATF
jgi:magnesium-transporting ATPase (P-type)